MRLKKGSKVEVRRTEGIVTGSWRCAEIISGNGRTYTVKFGWFPITSAEILEKVPRKAIRPCPPPVEGLDNWVPGDIVEVYHNLSWRTAIVMEVMDLSCFLVRLLGLTKEFQVHKSYLRVRQSWEKGTWFIVGQGSGNCGILKEKKQTDVRTALYARDDHFIRKKKRSPFVSSYVESCSGVAQKVRVVEKCGSRQRVFLEKTSLVSEKVDAYVYPQELLGEKYAHSFSNSRKNELGRREVDRRGNSSLAETSIEVDTDSCASSVGSCSANSNDVHNLPFSYAKHRKEDRDSLCSDAESFCGRGYEEEECLPPFNEKLMLEVGNGSDAESFYDRGYAKEDYPLALDDKLVAGVHRPELLTYRCFIESLYASGPLTWEEELKMSNLRHSLRISDDEHLMELRNLIAT